MQIVHKIKIFMILVSLQSRLLSAAEYKESEFFSDENDVQLYVSLYPHLHEGFEVLKAYDQSLPTFYDFLKTRINIDDQITFDDEDNTLTDEKYPNFGNVIEKAESVIGNKMKDSFLTVFQDTMKNPSQSMDEINDSIFRYVMNHRDGFMKPILRNWIKSKNSNDETLLSMAVEHDNLQAVKVLLAAGFNHLTRSHFYHEIAFRRHYLYLCKLRIDNKDLNWRSDIFHQDKVKFEQFRIQLNKCFFNCMQADFFSENHIVKTSYKKLLGMIKIALEMEDNSSVDNCLGDGYSDALLNYDGARYLLKQNVVHSYKFGMTPLHQAVANNSIEMIQMLIDNHVDVNSKDILDVTPLAIAAENNLLEAMRILIHAGAHVNAKNILGLTPLHCAIKDNCMDCFMFLILTPGIDLEIKVVPIIQRIDNILYWRSVKITRINKGKTPLFLAIEARNVEMVKKLLEAGVNPNMKNDKNDEDFRCTNAPLHFAAQICLLEIIDLLIFTGADINMQDCLGNTPLHYVYYHEDLWNTLMIYNPNIDVKNNKDETAQQLRMNWLSDHLRWQEGERQRRNQARQQASCCAIS